jgi:hypothetical protein
MKLSRALWLAAVLLSAAMLALSLPAIFTTLEF